MTMRDLVSPLVRQRLRRARRPAWFGTLRRTRPLSAQWGFDRGTPVDRHYIDQFLESKKGAIRGRVVEIGTSQYTDRFGSALTHSDVLDVDAANARATIVADLRDAHGVASESFDCAIVTQTLQFVYESEEAVRELHRLLRPGGALLATVPALSKIDPHLGVSGDFWRFTVASSQRLFGDVFGPANVTVHAYGNVLAAIAFLMGVSREELSRKELEQHDEYFPLLIAVHAVKA